jgi:CubicO group peptidase (beta-lactamase class C family)
VLDGERLEGIVIRARAEHHVPGIAVAAVVDGTIAWFVGAGWADIETGEAPGRRSLARVASVTKTFTATAIYQLRDAGRIQLTDPIEVHIPEFAAVRERGGRRADITIARLLTHRSGLVTESPPTFWDRPEFPSLPAILAALPDTEVAIPADTDWKYSNLGFALLGEVVSRRSGEPYADYVAGHIFEPLGMTDCAYELDDRRQALAMRGYQPGRFQDRPEAAPTAFLQGLTAAGQLHANVEDLARWIAFQTGRHPSGAAVLSAATLAESHEVRYVQPDWLLGQTAGWRIVRRGERLFHNHGGSVHGFNSSVAFHLSSGTGVVVLANLWPAAVATPLAMDLLDAVVDATPERVAIGTPPAAAPPETLPILGRYRAEPGVDGTLEWRDGGLWLLASPGAYALHAPVELVPEDGSWRRFRFARGRAAGEDAVFVQDGGRWTFPVGGFTYRQE